MKRNASIYSDNSILLFPVNKMRHSRNVTIDRIFLGSAPLRDGRKSYTFESKMKPSTYRCMGNDIVKPLCNAGVRLRKYQKEKVRREREETFFGRFSRE